MTQFIDKLKFRPVIPMGAVKDDDNLEKYINNEDYIAEVKYDGYRMLGWFDRDRIRFTSRSIAIETARAGEPWPTERTDNVPHLRDLIFDETFYGTIVDGEFYKEGCTSHDITSMVGGLPSTSIINQEREGKVSYVMYDILQFKGEDVTNLPLKNRKKLLFEVAEMLWERNEGEYVRLAERVPHFAKRETYNQLVAHGGEGLVLKHINSKYYTGKIQNGKAAPAKMKASRTKGIPFTPWVKWKKYDTFDCVVLGFSPAEVEYKGNDQENWNYWQDEWGNKYIFANQRAAQINVNGAVKPITKFHYYGWPGAIIFGQYHKGKLVEVGQTSGISDSDREEFARDPNAYIGRVVEVGAMERIKKTNALREPRFIRFRDDKNPGECVIE